ncbi:MAG: regulator of sigma E protease [Limisphaerales bacterium]|jgi:regulator of sigma E protease
MQILIQVGQLILALSILVFIHELGHFLAARMFGIKVEKFFVFFDFGGKKLFSFTRGDTEYGLGWFPLGGYVKIAGMIDESMDKEQLKAEPEEWEFRSKPNWQKFIVMVAGIVMNLILGVCLYAFFLGNYQQGYISSSEFNKDGVFAYELAREYGFQQGDQLVAVNGKSYDRFDDYVANFRIFFGGSMTVLRNGSEVEIEIPKSYFAKVKVGEGQLIELRSDVYIDSIPENAQSGASQAGAKAGDQIVSISGDEVFSFGDLQESLIAHKGDTVELGIMRSGNLLTLNPRIDTNGKLGFIPTIESPYSDSTFYTVGTSLKYGATDAWGWLWFNAQAIGKMFTSKDVKATESLASPIAIAQIYGPTWEWAHFWWLTAILSMILAFMNALPIPALDGGHMMFIIIESVTRRKLSESFMEKAQIFGMVIIMMLMVFAFGNDIFKLITG